MVAGPGMKGVLRSEIGDMDAEVWGGCVSCADNVKDVRAISGVGGERHTPGVGVVLSS